MARRDALWSPGFVAINVALALVTSVAALFFAFAGYLALIGVSPAMSGLIIAADALAALVVQPLIAPLIDGTSARRWLVGGALLLAAALFMLARVSSLPLLLAARLAQGAGFIAALSALTALLVGHIPPAMSGRAFGIASLIRLLPYAIIPFFFDRCALTADDFTDVLDIAVGVALLPLAVVLLPGSTTPPVAEVAHSAHSAAARPRGGTRIAASLRSPPIRTLLASALLFFSTYAAIFFFLKAYATTRAIANASLFFSIATLTMIGVRLAASGLFDRCDKARFGAAGLLLVAVCTALLAIDGGPTLFFVLAALSGLGWGIAMPLQAAAMFDISEAPARAMNQNLLLVMMQGGFFIGPFVGGLLISAAGYPLFFAVLAALTLLAAALMLRLRAPTAK